MVRMTKTGTLALDFEFQILWESVNSLIVEVPVPSIVTCQVFSSVIALSGFSLKAWTLRLVDNTFPEYCTIGSAGKKVHFKILGSSKAIG